MTDDRFVKSYKSPAFHPKIRIVALQNAPEKSKNVCCSLCKSQKFCPVGTSLDLAKLTVHIYGETGSSQIFGAEEVMASRRKTWKERDKGETGRRKSRWRRGIRGRRAEGRAGGEGGDLGEGEEGGEGGR